MLYDYKNAIQYSFDFYSLINSYKNNSPLQGQNNYLNSWERILLSLSKSDNNPIYFKSETAYQHIIHCLDSQVFKLHFDISSIANSISKKDLPIQFLSSDLFGTDDSPIRYTYEPYNQYHLQSSKPVILAPITLDTYIKFIVIDGNHRVSAKKENVHTDIPVIMYNPTKAHDFVSPINWAFYLFFIETYNFGTQIILGNDFSDLLPLSYIHHTFSDIV